MVGGSVPEKLNIERQRSSRGLGRRFGDLKVRPKLIVLHNTFFLILACAVYFWARLAHAIVYTLGVPVLRSLAFTVGFLAQAVLALAIFRVF